MTTMAAPSTLSSPNAAGTPLVEVRNLVKHFPIKGGVLQRTVGIVHAVDNVSFDIRRGATLGLVGESGCGKTTVGRALPRLSAAVSGRMRSEGVCVTQSTGSSDQPQRR